MHRLCHLTLLLPEEPVFLIYTYVKYNYAKNLYKNLSCSVDSLLYEQLSSINGTDSATTQLKKLT